MKTLRLGGLALALIASTGCSTTASNRISGGENGAATTTVHDRAFDSDLTIREARLTDADGYLEVHVFLQSKSRASLSYESKIEWLDGSGYRIESPLEAWRPGQIEALDAAEIKAVAPTRQAKSYRFHIRRPNPIL